MRFLVGTLTRFGGPGVALCALEEGRLRLLWTQGGLSDPNWITGSRVPGRVYLVSSDSPGEHKGLVHQATLEKDGLRLERRATTGGNGPCHLAVSADERFLTAANYGTGSLAVFAIGPEGLEERIQLVKWTGQGHDPIRQTGPHAHQVSYLPGLPGFLCATDLGTDQVKVYQQDPESGLLTECYCLRLPDGQGPRHLVHTPEISYLVTEMGSRVFPLRFGPEDGQVVGEGVSTLPAGYASRSTGAAIRLSPDGRWLYVSNRGHDSVAALLINGDGSVQPPARWLTAGGRTPRDFVALPDGSLLTACQELGLTLLRDGLCAQRLPLMGAVCLLELPDA